MRASSLQSSTPSLASRARSQPHVRNLGLGIEGRPSGSSTLSNGRTSRALRRASTMSAWTWAGGKSDAQITTEEAPAPSDGMFIPGERSRVGAAHEVDQGPRRARQVATTLALLDAFRAHTAAVPARFAVLLETRRCQQADLGGVPGVVCFTPKDVMSFELGPFSGLDARFIEWLGEEYGGGVRVVVKRGWKDLIGLVLGLG